MRRDNARVSSGNKTTSIPRPTSASSRSPSRTRSVRRTDVTRPVPADARLVQPGRPRLVLGVVAVLIVVALAGALFVLPVKAWMNQRADLAERQAELAALQEATAQLEADIARLQTPEGIEDAARDELGYVELGERRIAVVDVPNGSVTLPPGWPYSLVQQIVAVRAMPPVEPAPSDAG